ncbi:hypothetical protein [uncultured Methanobacterium sp.]|uniref:hypothetical protein n=1 Tax=uncultured Methanobacterium sp. TaxID=176306 RepID=UPI002805E5E1|nr:hypothetical protein [uncultured Methanobacterium sp.]
MAKTEWKLFVNDPDKLEKDFYEKYDPDYWLYKIYLLKNSHDDYDKIKENLTGDLVDVIHEDYKRMIRTELHFLYFQMIETLFELIFAISKFTRQEIWAALTFSNKRNSPYYYDCYGNIRELSHDRLKDPDLWAPVKIGGSGGNIEIPLIRWIFYDTFNIPEMSEEDWEINLDNIYYFLRKFAKDFSDREEYNAYKHSLRFFNTQYAFGFALKGSSNFFGRRTDNSIVYLAAEKNNNDSYSLKECSKAFDFKTDYNRCILIHDLISNIIITRKAVICKPPLSSAVLTQSAMFHKHKKEDFEYKSFLKTSFPR